ncbi:electron transport complex subunit RsxC [Hydrogenovibrio sp. JE_KL2]|uniref:electron transport complex subunit RsxC n=1 Tax=Hydrogenovibrio sp. JE_KL2 TaxID=2651188 RepID=UPI00128C7719|nr:electron transport complex subunit RsxC [Hydrogenovibrio sp. JE_KL2]MPQ75825.1 electron transport complex subunit RsxC [Hydrogenovibrio sp. JE_KL2]
MKTGFFKFLAKIYPMAKRRLYRFSGGVFPRYNKSLSKQHPIHKSFIPNELILPLHQHVGVETEPKVQVGDKVLKNQCLAESKKGLSAPVHAPTSGEIVAIENRTLPHPSGLTGLCIVLKPDFKDEAIDNILKTDGKTPSDPKALKELVYRAGIVGMGGAGFPTFAKIPDEKGKIHTLLVNGAECEPFITCDDILMQTHPKDIIHGAIIVAEALGCERIICGIEDNKPEAIESMQAAVAELDHPNLVEIQPVPTVYPMGGQKQLTQQLTGIEVPAHAHAVDIGLLMMNVATFAAIFHAVRHGKPLTSRYVTVSGLGLNHPFNIEALIGTSFEDLVELAEPKTKLNYPLVQGGPMMGFEMPNNHVPVIKTTNCILANPPKPAEMVMPCIRCGECMDACPVNLLPQQLYWHARSHEFDKAEKLNLFDCIECGCCSFVCPSHIPLVQYYRFAKGEVKKNKQETLATQRAKERHEAKLAREERIKQEREAKLKAKKEAVKRKAANEAEQEASTPAPEQKAPSSAAAAARAAAARKKAAQSSDATTTESTATSEDEKQPGAPLSAREKAIAAARKRAEAATEKSEPQAATNPAMSARGKAMAAAKKRAQAAAKKSENTESESETAKDTSSHTAEVDSPELDAKTRARLAAQKRAQEMAAKRQMQADQTEISAQEENTAKVEEAPVVDKRQAAMEAAKKRAAARKKPLPDNTETSGSDS